MGPLARSLLTWPAGHTQDRAHQAHRSIEVVSALPGELLGSLCPSTLPPSTPAGNPPQAPDTSPQPSVKQERGISKAQERCTFPSLHMAVKSKADTSSMLT